MSMSRSELKSVFFVCYKSKDWAYDRILYTRLLNSAYAAQATLLNLMWFDMEMALN